MSAKRWLTPVALCVLAVVLRLAAYAAFPGIYHSDEFFQYVEQAHRLVYGSGLVPWEYAVGIRSWLFPGVLAGALQAARLFADGPVPAGWAVALFMIFASLPVVLCGWAWGRRAAGFEGGLLSGGLNAVWFQLVYASIHALADTLGASCLAVGLCLSGRGRGRAFVAGVAFGLAVLLRLHLAPAVVLGMAGTLWYAERTAARAALGGAALVVLLAGALDWLTLGAPFQSLWMYAWLNQTRGISATYGTSPWYEYATYAWYYWSFVGPLIVGLAVLGAARLPLLFAVALAIVATLSAVAHKESRFAWPALPLMLTLAGVGTAMLVQRLEGQWRLTTVALAGWVVVSATLGVLFAPAWESGVTVVRAMHAVSEDPASCGLAVYPRRFWSVSGGYAHLRPGIAIQLLDEGGMPPDTPTYDWIMAFGPADFSASGFARVACAPAVLSLFDAYYRYELCMWRRPGVCATPQSFDLPLPGAAH